MKATIYTVEGRAEDGHTTLVFRSKRHAMQAARELAHDENYIGQCAEIEVSSVLVEGPAPAFYCVLATCLIERDMGCEFHGWPSDDDDRLCSVTRIPVASVPVAAMD